MKHTLEEINSQQDEAEKWSSNLKDKVAENTQMENKFF